MSGGGGKLEVINTRERAVSTDINRLQAFQAYDRAEIARRLHDMRLTVGAFAGPYGGGILETGSFVDTTAEDTASVGTPLKGDVIEGLCVLPQTGTLNLLVQPGAVWLDDPDTIPNPDDSRYKLVVDPGVSLAGTLVIGAGAGSTRIDIIECQRQTVVVETDSRDIFDPSTGLFSAVSVTKVTEGRLVYRVRAGTPGAGFPANVSGWLPLCVASVPSSAVNVDTITFWDVRPLVKDRVNAPADSQSALNFYNEKQRINAVDKSITTTHTLVYGYSEAQIGMYRAGGLLEVEASPFVDVELVTNQANGYTPILNSIWYLYAVFFGNLPRWVRYNAGGASPRIPAGPNGVMVVSDIGPSSSDGGALFQTTIPAPLASGLVANGSAAVLMCAGYTLDSGSPDLKGFVQEDGLMQSATPHIVAHTSVTATTDTYHFLANGHFPRNAKSLLVSFIANWTGTPGDVGTAQIVISIYKPGTTNVLLSMDIGTIVVAIDAVTSTIRVDLPLVPENLLAGFPTDNLELKIDWAQSLGTKATSAAHVLGWRL